MKTIIIAITMLIVPRNNPHLLDRLNTNRRGAMNQKLTNALKLSIVVVFLSLAGCATTSDVNNALAAANKAQATANAAMAKANEAEQAAKEAKVAAGGAMASCKAEDEKCLRMYKKSMEK
jgi:Alanine-zipper, major outer membrane lipoprotein